MGVPLVYTHQELSDAVYGRYQVLVMEKLGSSVRSLTKEASGSRMSEDVRTRNLLLFAVQALQRLEDIHSHGILHNDIKPENFLLGTGEKNNTVYLIDFGISALYRPRDLHALYSDGHSRKGTPGYQSLHNLLGEGRPTSCQCFLPHLASCVLINDFCGGVVCSSIPPRRHGVFGLLLVEHVPQLPPAVGRRPCRGGQGRRHIGHHAGDHNR